MNGIVIKTTGKYYTVINDDRDVVKCRLKGRFRVTGMKSTNPIVVGDKVVLERESEIWMIIKLHERKNYLLRKAVNLSKQTHILAANIDQAILMITIDSPETSTGFVDRFLVTANANAIDVILIFNKTDLLNDKLKLKQQNLQKVYEKIGYKCFSLSVRIDDLSRVKDLMKGNINMISGHSGVGKSTFINKLQPNLNINTNKISSLHKKGRHTTTFSELYALDSGGSIIDTPGIRGFGLVDLELNHIRNYFPEFLTLQKSCKFHNCIHKEEPSCAVKINLKKGEIAESRYTNYLNMLLEERANFRTNNY
jgi:ribosome biogenesis GTPase